jgi:hypothetical protein
MVSLAATGFPLFRHPLTTLALEVNNHLLMVMEWVGPKQLKRRLSQGRRI